MAGLLISGDTGVPDSEIEKGHVEEGIKEVNKRLVAYFNIEGWKFTVEPLMTAEEAIPMLGL